MYTKSMAIRTPEAPIDYQDLFGSEKANSPVDYQVDIPDLLVENQEAQVESREAASVEKIEDYARQWFEGELHAQKHLDTSKKEDLDHNLNLKQQIAARLEDIIDDHAFSQEGSITDKFANAVATFLDTYVDFCLEKLNTADPGEFEAVKAMVYRLSHEMFGMSPSLLNYVGGINRMLDLAARMTSNPELNIGVGQSMLGELNYEINFSPEEDVFDDLFEGKTNLESLQMAEILERVGEVAVDNSDWSANSMTRIMGKLAELEKSQAPIISLKSRAARRKLIERYNYWEYGEQPTLNIQQQEYRDDAVHGGEPLGSLITLPDEFTKDRQTIRIAADAIAIADSRLIPTQIGLMEERSNNRTRITLVNPESLANNSQINPLKVEVGEDTKELLQFMHQPDLKMEIEQAIGVSLNEIPLRSQIHLLKFLVEADQNQFQRLQSVLSNQSSQKSLLLESFLALEMGDEFGNSLLTIHEHLPAQESQRLLESINKIRELAPQFGHLMTPNSPEVSQAIHLALVKRTTEILAVAEALAIGEIPEAEVEQGRNIRVEQIEEVHQALEILIIALQKAIDSTSSSEMIRQDESTAAVRLGNGDVLIQARKRAVEKGKHDTSREFNGEQRVNILINVLNQLSVPEEIDHILRKYALSLRLDNKDGVALDIGRSKGDPEDPNYLVGRIVALGNALLSLQRGQPIDGHHVRVFPDKLKDPVVFEGLVEDALQAY